jgi:hypothetical protein
MKTWTVNLLYLCSAPAWVSSRSKGGIPSTKAAAIDHAPGVGIFKVASSRPPRVVPSFLQSLGGRPQQFGSAGQIPIGVGNVGMPEIGRQDWQAPLGILTIPIPGSHHMLINANILARLDGRLILA